VLTGGKYRFIEVVKFRKDEARSWGNEKGRRGSVSKVQPRN
jgi:hypothetical protein